MKSTLTTYALLAALISLTPPLFAEEQARTDHSNHRPTAVAEQACPVSGEPLDADAVTVEHNEKQIKLCCKDCKKTFLEAPGKYLARMPMASPAAGTYPLNACVVSGMKLGSMGPPYVHTAEGREVRFCCKGCLPKFQKDPAKYLKKLDSPMQENKPAAHKAGSHGHKHHHETLVKSCGLADRDWPNIGQNLGLLEQIHLASGGFPKPL